MKTYEKLNKLAKESHNDEFWLAGLDWTTRVTISDLCKIIDQQDEKINNLITIMIKADTNYAGDDTCDQHYHSTFEQIDLDDLAELLNG